MTAIVDTVPPSETISSTIGTSTGLTATITSGGLTKDNTLTLSGTVSDLNGVSSVHVFDGANDLGVATIDGSGNWSLTTGALTDGTHSFTATATDNAGNSTTTAAVTASIDTQNPTLAINIVDGALSDSDNSSVVTFTFSEVPAGFTASDIAATHGTVTGLTQDLVGDPSGKTYTATFTADDGFTGTGSVSVASGSYTDAALNLGGPGSDNVTIDTQNPTLAINIVDGALSDSDNSSVVTFTFSEVPAGFTASDIAATHGTVTGLTQDLVGDPSGKTYTATFTADDGFTGTGSVSVASGSYTDAALNLGGPGSDNVTIDTQNPTLAINIVDGALSDSDNSSVVTFTFSEVPAGFTASDIAATHGTVTGLTQDLVGDPSGKTYTATFTADDGFTGTGSVSVASGSYTDAALNLGGPGSDNVTIDTQNPTLAINIVDGALSDSDNSSVVTFTFSEVPAGFTASDIAATHGTVTGLTQDLVGDPSGKTYTATFTADDGFTGTGSVSVASGSYTDAALNLGGPGSDNVTIDTQNPTLAINIVDGALSDSDNSSVVTFTFSEVPAGFTASDIAATHGTVTGLTQDLVGDPSGKTYTATFTADDGFTGTGSVSVASGSYTDASGNLGGPGSDNVTIDTQNSTLAINIVDGALSDSDNSSVVTFTFSEVPAGFTASDIAATHGTVTGLTQDLVGDPSGKTYTATFTADDGFTGTGSVSVASGSYTDAALNLGGPGSDNVTIDTQNPTLAINIVDGALSDSDNSSVVTFTFSEVPAGFTASDIAATHGTVTGLTQDLVGDPSGKTYTATFTADDGFTGTGSVSVASGSYTDAALNLGGPGSDNVTIDTQNPTLAINIVDGALSDSDNSSVVTFTFSEVPAGFTASDIAATHGTVTGLTQDLVGDPSGKTYTATFTADDGFTGTGSVSVASGSYTDAALNLGGPGSDNVTIDTQNPTLAINIVDGALSDSDNSSVVTFTFSEVPAGFTASDIAATHGTVTGLTQDLVGDPSGKTYTATFTADDGFTGTGSVSVASGSYTDAALNLGGPGSDNVTIDTQNPTLAINIVDGALSDSDNSSVVTFTFSEVPAGFTASDIAATHGTVTGLTQDLVGDPSGKTYTATFTADDGFTGTGSVSVASGSYTDAALNLGGPGSDNVTIDTQNPTLAINIVDGALSASDNSSVVTFIFSEVPAGFTASDIAATHGTLSGFSATANPLVYTATFTAQDDFIGNGSVSVASGSYTDAALNLGASGSDSVAINTDDDLVGTLSGLTGGNAVEEQTVRVNTLSDGGLNIIGDTIHVHYSWQVFRNGAWYQEGNQRSFTPNAADLGDQLRVVVSYDEQEPGESGTETIILSAGSVLDEAPGAAGFADATGNGNWQTSNKWSSNQVPGAGTNVELDGNGGFQIAVNDVRSANSLNISGSGNSVVLNGASTPGLNINGAVTVLNGGLLDLSANGATLMAGSITGTITVDNNAVITGSSGSTIVGPSGTGPWAEIITSATIVVTSSGKIVSDQSPGTGGLAIDSGATLTLTGGTHTENILFANNFPDNHLYSGTLVISGGTAFTGFVYGFGAADGFSDIIYLKSISFDAGTTWAYTDNIGSNTGGTLAIFENGTQETSIAFGNGDFITANFKLTSDGGSGMFIADPPATTDPVVAATAETTLTANTDMVSLVGDANRVLATNSTATNGDTITGGTGSDMLTIDTGPGVKHTFVFGDGASDHSDIGLTKFETLTLTDQTADATHEDAVTVAFNSDFKNNGTLTVDGSALHDLKGTNLTVDAHLASHDSFIFIGSANADTLIGGPQNDTFIGGGGGDTMKGGGGSDAFVFKTVTDSQPGTGHFDTITDFTAGTDRIDLSAIVGASNVQGLVGMANTVAANSISWFADNAHNETVLYVNTTAAANHVDMEIHLTGTNINLTGSDILHHA